MQPGYETRNGCCPCRCVAITSITALVKNPPLVFVKCVMRLSATHGRSKINVVAIEPSRVGITALLRSPYCHHGFPPLFVDKAYIPVFYSGNINDSDQRLHTRSWPEPDSCSEPVILHIIQANNIIQPSVINGISGISQL